MPNVLRNDQIDTMFSTAVDILSSAGVEFELESARALFKKNGIQVDGKRVFIPSGFLADQLKLMPAYTYEPVQSRRLIAASPFSNAPMILDDISGTSRRGTVEDVIKMYQLAETSDLYAAINPGIVDPTGNDSDNQYLSQIAMMLKYSDRFPSLGLRASKSNSKNADVYASAKKAIQLIKKIKGDDENPVMGQGICPLAPLAYDEECLLNLEALVEEGQSITICPCTLSYMTGPESLMGVVIHDIALSLAGAVYIQLLEPGTAVSFSNFSTMTDMKTLQPVYAGPEYLNVQIMFYEVCREYQLNCVLCGCFSDGTRNDYQGGFESCLTATAPFYMTEIDDIWCYPGHMAAFAGASFHKMIFDEELMINCNRTLQGLNLSVDPNLQEKLIKSTDTGNFIIIGDIGIYRKEQRVTPVFDKKGIAPGHTNTPESTAHLNAQKIIEKRCASYTLPERSKEQKALLQAFLPSQCRY